MSDKGEWWFYHIERGSLENALGPLLDKCLEKGWRVLVVADEARLADLDAALWTWSDESFTPHGRVQSEPQRQPVLLSSEAEPINGAQAIVLLDGMDADASKFERCMVMFDGADMPTRSKARDQYKTARDAGAVVKYYQQNTRGGWELKA